jgi:hypothetical protein
MFRGTNDRDTCSRVLNPSLYNRTSHVSWSPRRLSSTYRSLRCSRFFSITVVVVIGRSNIAGPSAMANNDNTTRTGRRRPRHRS